MEVTKSREIGLGRIGGWHMSAMPSTVFGSFLLWIILAAVGLFVLGLGLRAATLGGLAALTLHWVSELVHQLGHSRAAKRVQYPMIGVRLWGIFSTALYTPDEPPLPARVHIYRALGGPAASFLLTMAAAAIFLTLRSLGGLLFWLSLFLFLENLLLFTLGAFLPLGFTDGSTLLYWWPRR